MSETTVRRRPDAAIAATGRPRPIVTPFARALSVLAAFTAQDRWLCNGVLARRTGLPASTVTRMTHTLVALGYLRTSADKRQFSLTPATLGLGYRAAADTVIHHVASAQMSAFAERHQVHVNISLRDRLDLVVIDACPSPALPSALQLEVGTRMGLASTAAGWALLASLPASERHYLLRSAEQGPACARNGGWRNIRRRSIEALDQVRAGGFCVALGEAGQPMTMVAAPIQLPGRAPLAVSCIGPALLTGRQRSVRDLGPALVGMAHAIERAQALA